MSIFLEDYLESIQGLPGDIQRELMAMRDKDQQFQSLREGILRKQSTYFKAKKLGKTDVDNLPAKITSEYNKAIEIMEDKLQAAQVIYDLTDKHIKKLDSDLKLFEKEMEDENLKLEKANELVPQKEKKRKTLEEKAPRGTPGRKRIHRSATSEAAVPDVAIDPNEPVYCICRQVSFGDMVACDNDECPTEWFHYSCVGLTSPPKGKWYCSDCLASMKIKKKL